MGLIYVADYTAPIRYALDPVSGAVTATRVRADKEAVRNTAGFGAWRRVGLLRNRRKLFVALYTDAKTLLMRIGDQVFDWADPNLRVARTAVAPFLKRFTVYRGETEILRLDYWYTDREVWPDNGDIFSYIDRTTHTRAEILRAIFLWTASAQGRDLTGQELADELDRRVTEALRQR